MKIAPSMLAYLHGDAFSNGLTVQFESEPDDDAVRSRIDWLEELCAQRRVVHVGCVDHDLTQVAHKRKRGKWLHERLCGVTERCLGVDINAQGIAQLKDELGYDDVLAADLLVDSCEPVFASQWDDFLLGEVLEHIGNPVAFLTQLRKRFQNQTKRFIITVPNAFAAENMADAREGIERINSDHRFWFTPYTLSKVCVDAGLTPSRLLLCRNGIVKRRSILKNWKLSRRPWLRNNIILLADLSVSAD
ncbi:MAG: methyltransferase domain-containing protein [Chromatiales bacterium]|jgi:hypothetical protein|nr:methyltransferase domain-containing protein [Chromatiales bacterium]